MLAKVAVMVPVWAWIVSSMLVNVVLTTTGVIESGHVLVGWLGADAVTLNVPCPLLVVNGEDDDVVDDDLCRPLGCVPADP
jgi:hypothetical protein